MTYRPVKKGTGGVVLLTGADNKVSQRETPNFLAHNYILNLAFQGDDIWVATAKGLSHGMRETLKERRKKNDHRQLAVDSVVPVEKEAVTKKAIVAAQCSTKLMPIRSRLRFHAGFVWTSRA